MAHSSNSSLGREERHALGAHFTYESDIQKIVRPTIIRPWEERTAAAKTAADLLALLKELRRFRVLDPACGSGNFLFVAYRGLREVEQRLLLRLFAQDKRQFAKVGLASGISPGNFFGIDVNENAVETAKVTLMLARRLAHREAEKFWADHADELPGLDTHSLEFERDLPLDNLDDNIRCTDALFAPWPQADAIIGNPPFQSKNKMQQEFGPAYARKVRKAFPGVPGRADFCVYWFRKAHDHLKAGQRAGLVGTNTIRQNYSREGSLDYIVQCGGTITEAVSSQVWSGEAVVNVSLVNWIRQQDVPGDRALYEQLGDNRDSPWRQWRLPRISSALSARLDVTSAKKLAANSASPLCKQGQTPGHRGFLVAPEAASRFLRNEARNREVLWPYLVGKTDLLGLAHPEPTRWIIDFHPRDMLAAARYTELFKIVKDTVLKSRERGACDEEGRNRELEQEDGEETGNRHHRQFLEHWWLLSWPRPELIRVLATLPRYIVCVRVTKRPIFEFVSSQVRPSDALAVFPTPDNYSFGILQSGIHWDWFNARCSTLKRDPRYTSDTVFDTFAWPQSPKPAQIKAVAEVARIPARPAPADHGSERLVPARTLSHPRNPRRQPTRRRTRRPRLRGPHRLRHESQRGSPRVSPKSELGTCRRGG